MKKKSLSSFLPSNLQHFSWSMQKWWWTNCKSRAESAADQDSHELPRNGNKMSITEIPRQQMLMLLPTLQIWISRHFPNIVYPLISWIDYQANTQVFWYFDLKDDKIKQSLFIGCLVFDKIFMKHSSFMLPKHKNQCKISWKHSFLKIGKQLQTFS